MDGYAETEFKETEVGPIPVEWDVVPLGEMADYVNGAAFKPSQWSDKGLPIVRIQNLTGTSEVFNCFEGELPTKYLLRDGDLLISWSASLGVFRWYGGDAWLNQHIFKVVNIRESVDGSFLQFVVRYHIGLLTQKTRGSTMRHVVRETFLETAMPLPPLPEQRRIAAVLNAIQEAIAAQEDVIAAARAFKRSLMQRLFTYGPGPVPAETKETEVGPIPVEWEFCPIGELVLEVTGGDWGEESGAQGLIECYVVRGTDFGDVQSGVFTDVPRRHIKPASLAKRQLKSDSLLVEISGGSEYQPTGRLLRTTSSTLEKAQSPVVFTNFLKLIRLDTSATTPAFFQLFWEYLYGLGRTRVYEKRTTGIRNFKFKEFFENEVVLLPPLPEQRRIADMLNAVEQSIAVEEDRRAALQDLFKSALHQLMTGRIRLLSDEGLPL
ncbi:MAG: restriction endonuclease subunit S [Anaerolineae bacterium]|nr:restriction endonuclease subunit S [Anaerolineae bacterium]